MPETDILNPTAGWDTALGDSMNPSYGFTRKRSSTLLHKKPMGGKPWTRETQNTGHSFNLGWLGRTWACAQRLKWYYEQYENGYFTICNWDAGGRQYVGRFATEPQETETANNKWDVTATFEELPGSPMVAYPSDWNHESILLNVTADDGDQKLAFNGAWTQAALGTAPTMTLGGILRDGTKPLPTTVMNDPGTPGDWATYEYRGYGFKLWLVTGPAQGKADVYIDSVLNSTVDCYAASAAAATMVLAVPNLPLDIHDVELVCDGTKNGASSATNIGWYGLQVMR